MHRMLLANGFVCNSGVYSKLDALNNLLHFFLKTGT